MLLLHMYMLQVVATMVQELQCFVCKRQCINILYLYIAIFFLVLYSYCYKYISIHSFCVQARVTAEAEHANTPVTDFVTT